MGINLVNETPTDDLIRASEEFEKELTEYLAMVEKIGGREVEIRTDYLYSRTEGLQCDSAKMLLCMRVMKVHMLPGDEVIHEPDDFDGRFLKIRFRLPREASKKVEKKG